MRLLPVIPIAKVMAKGVKPPIRVAVKSCTMATLEARKDVGNKSQSKAGIGAC
jgi:hypothetical protein